MLQVINRTQTGFPLRQYDPKRDFASDWMIMDVGIRKIMTEQAVGIIRQEGYREDKLQKVSGSDRSSRR